MAKELNIAFDQSYYNEYTRKFQYTIAPLLDIFENRTDRRVGSAAEGTQFYSSDCDYLFINRSGVKVGYNPQAPNLDKDIPYLCLTRGPSTPAGYTKFKIYLNGTPYCNDGTINVEQFFDHELYVNDKQECFLTNGLNAKLTNKCRTLNVQRHGPASTTETRNNSIIDSVLAFESEIIPNDMNSWFERARRNNWPSRKTFELFKSMGCCYVGIGHLNSPEQDLEWRISPTKQELHLMLNLNQTQFRCYILLKIIKKHFIQQHCGDFLSSYHCKTALFYTIENTDTRIWQPHYLMICIFQCFRLLYKWIIGRNCPNYFFPEENMFETKAIDNSLNEKWFYIIEKLQHRLFFDKFIHDMFSLESKHCVQDDKYRFYSLACGLKGYLQRLPDDVLALVEHTKMCIGLLKTRPRHSIRLLKSKIDPYNINIVVLLEIYEERLLYLNEFVNLKSAIMSKLDRYLNAYDYLHELPNKLGKTHEYCLKLASIASANGEYILCDALLQNIYEMYNRVLTTCECYISYPFGEYSIAEHSDLYIINNIMPTGENINKISVKDLLRKFTFCLKFYEYEYEAGIVTSPLQYDAHKTIGIPSGSEKYVNTNKVFIAIHPMVYHFFLQYKNSEILDEKCDMCVALAKIEHINETSLLEQIYCHPDTILNLLGHIYLTKGWYRLAVQCFRRSLQLISHYNAVKWHVMFMLFCNLGIHEKKKLTGHLKRKIINTVDDEFSPFRKLIQICK